MRNRSVWLALTATAAGLAAAGWGAAQSPPGGYTPGKTQPAGGQLLPATTVRPYSEWTPTGNPQPGQPKGVNAYTPGAPPGYSPYGNTQPAAAGNQYPAAGMGAAAPPAGRPRLTQPVTAGPDGVRPASFDVPPPSMDVPTTRPAAAEPAPFVPVPGGRPLPPAAPEPARPTTGDSKFPAGPEVKTAAPVAPPAMTPVRDPAPFAPPAAPVAVTPKPAETADPKPASPALSPAPAAAMGSLPGQVSPGVRIEAVAPATVNFGQNFEYELFVRNGPVAVTGVRVEDELPMGAKYVSSDPPAEVYGEKLTWAVGNLDAGAERRIKVTVKPSEEGEIHTRATVSFSAAVDAKTRVTRPRLSVTISGPELCKVGEEVPFAIKVMNSGSGPASLIRLQARLTEGLYHSQGGVIEAELVDLPAGQTKSVTLKVVANRAGLHGSQIQVAADGSPDATARAAVNVVEPLLQVKQSGPTRCLVRSEPTYTIELANPGTAATDPVQLQTLVPEGFEVVSASDGGQFSKTGTRTVGWRLPALAAGSTRTVSLKLRAEAAVDGLLRTVATAGPEQVLPAAAGNGGVMGVSARTAPRLESKTESPVKAEGVPAVRFEVIGLEGVVEVGKEAVYEVRVTNQGTGPCSNVQLAAGLAEGAVYTGSSGPTQVRAQGQQLLFDPIPQLGVKAEAVYRVRVRGGLPGDLRFRVQLTCDQVRTPVVKEESTRFYKE